MGKLITPQLLSITTGTGDNDTVATKGYVDDQAGSGSAIHEVLTISGDGQTAFTLGSTPADVTSSILSLNGQIRIYTTDFTISGTSLTWNDPGGTTLKTTDDFQIWYNVSIGGGILDQDQIYYVADAGSDANNGKSVEAPFLTEGAAVSAVAGQTPSATNRYLIKVMGGVDHDVSSITLPDYTSLVYDKGSRVTGRITFGAESNVLLDQYLVPGSGSGLIVPTGKTGYASWSNMIDDGATAVGVHVDGGTLNVTFEEVNMDNNSGSKFYNLLNSAEFRATGNLRKETALSSSDVTSHSYLDVNEDRTGEAKFILNEKGNIDLRVEATNKIRHLFGSTIISENVGIYHKFNNIPMVSASTTGAQTDITGDGTPATCIYNNEIGDNNLDYNPTTGVFTAPIGGFYYISAAANFGELDGSHNALDVRITTTLQGDVSFYLQDPISSRFNVALGLGEILVSGGQGFFMDASDTAEITVQAFGSTKTVDFNGGYLSIHLVSAT